MNWHYFNVSKSGDKFPLTKGQIKDIRQSVNDIIRQIFNTTGGMSSQHELCFVVVLLIICFTSQGEVG